MQFVDWGLVDYETALQKQLELVEMVSSGKLEDTIVFCSHPPVVTKGRVTRPEDITEWQGDVVEVSRGGRATYHGPSQIVIYPICSLEKPRGERKPHDIIGFLRDFETAIVKALDDLGIKAEGKSVREKPVDPNAAEETGVWVTEDGQKRKIASLGLAVKQWTTYHGAALNVEFDPTAFKGLMPCGFQPNVMISIEEKLGAKPDRSFIELRLQQRLLELFHQE